MQVVGLADLVRVLHKTPPKMAAKLAERVGYEKMETAPSPEPELSAESAGLERFEQEPSGKDVHLLPAPFLRAEHFEPMDELQENDAKDRSEAFTNIKDISGALGDKAAPTPPSLAPWSRLQRRLAELLKEEIEGVELNVAELVAALSRGDIPTRLPRRKIKRWPRHLCVLIDRSRRLTPFWHDQDLVLKHLKRQLGAGHVSEFRLHETLREPVAVGKTRKHQRTIYDGAPGVLLTLGDCGCLSHYQPLIAHWRRVGRRLTACGLKPNALFPGPDARWAPPVSRIWKMASWEQGGGATASGALLSLQARRLLALASPAIRIEPGLLRRIRRLLPFSQANAGTEADVWSRPEVASGSSVALTIAADKVKDLHSLFSGENALLRRQVLEAIREWRLHLPKLIWYEELVMRSVDEQRWFKREPALAKKFIKKVAATINSDPDSIGRLEMSGLYSWFDRFMPRTQGNTVLWSPDDVELGRTLQKAANTIHREESSVEMPQVYDPRLAEEKSYKRLWTIHQIGKTLRIFESGEMQFAPPAASGSPVARLESTRRILFSAPAEAGGAIRPKRSLVEPGKGLNLHAPSTGKWRLSSDRGVFTLSRLNKPGWAEAIGRDRFGLWVSFTFKDVTQKLRWMPPGQFLMGSPETEQGRLNWEKQHLVTLTQGYWLFDTPVTQALWQAVMSDNAAYFKSPDRPVEQVSWDACQAFMQKLNSHIPGLDLRFPTETEWEYACRAGTSAATWAGEIEILGENNAPILDDIAWYGGNSGVDFDLENGYDSSDWKEKQYDHGKAGTHPVGLKKPNPWGLYDMLGNVWEWCGDYWERDYPDGLVTDPTGPEKGDYRVCRGGGWGDYARGARAACRDYWEPDYRDYYLGLRCARGQA